MYYIANYPFTLRIMAAETAVEQAVTQAMERVLHAFRSATTSHFQPHDLLRIETPVGIIDYRSNDIRHEVNVSLRVPPDYPLIDIVDHIEPEIVNQAVRESPGHLWIHGACLVRDGRVILLVAETGTGKTTLSLGLLHYGYRLLTDDVILIDQDTSQIVPVPRCPKYRPPALDYLRRVGFDLSLQAELMGRYILLPRECFQIERVPLPIDTIYLLKRQSDEPSGCQEVSLTDGILALLKHSNILGLDPSLEMAIDWFQYTRFIMVNLREYADDLRLIANGDA